MAFKHGDKANLWLGSLDISQYFNNMTVAVSAETAETTTFTAAAKTFIEGQAAANLDAKGFYDLNNDATATGLIQNAGSTVTAFPAGAIAIGDLARLMKAHEVGIVESSPIGGAVLLTVKFVGEGDLTFGQALHVLGADTNTTTGAEKDDAAATTTGWTAHLHVTAVSGGSWVVKLQDAAVSNTYSDVSGGAFTAATTATSQRLLSASGATLRRYVRYVATRTGGAGGDSITFGLAYSRAI